MPAERVGNLLKHPTLDQLHALGRHGMAKAFADLADAGHAKDIAHAHWLAILLDREASWRRDKSLTARLRAAKLRQQASVEDVDYRAARGLDRAMFQKLSEGDWIDAHDNLALVGPSGVGKSWLACAIGHKAVATIGQSSIIAGQSAARTWRSPEATAAIRASSNPSAAPICSVSTTSASSLQGQRASRYSSATAHSSYSDHYTDFWSGQRDPQTLKEKHGSRFA
jgi:IstB-like ATP binding protein